MGERILAIVGASVVAVLLALHSPVTRAQAKVDGKTASKPTAPLAWKQVPEKERRVLAPVEKDWTTLSGAQQRRLLGAAKKYPTMVPIQQERFQERLKEWAELSPDQRRAARDKYKDLSKLPPAKQHELREKWQQEKSASGKDSAAAPQTLITK